MKDETTKQPLEVLAVGRASPYIVVPTAQLEELLRLLDGRHIGYFVEEIAISFNGAPEMMWVYLRRKGDASAVQKILDNAE